MPETPRLVRWAQRGRDDTNLPHFFMGKWRAGRRRAATVQHYITPAAHLSIDNLNKFRCQSDPIICAFCMIKKDQGSDPNKLKKIMVKSRHCPYNKYIR